MLKEKKNGKFIEIKNLIHKFTQTDEEGEIISQKSALDGISLDVKVGDFIVILGQNGSGKSTLAKHMNAILKPTSGTLFVKGIDTAHEENVWEVRQSVGMVFQNSDNQMIAQLVEEDVGFGPENLGIPTNDIWKRVETALRQVGMWEYRHYSPTRLSGGQKQRVAIAGVLAMKPDCIVLDESTAMLDPSGRHEVMETVRELNQKEGVTIILITHHIEEALAANRIFVMQDGKILLSGTPREVFSEQNKVVQAGLDLPVPVKMARMLRDAGISIKTDVLTQSEFVEEVLEFRRNKKGESIQTENVTEHKKVKKNPDVEKQEQKKVSNREKLLSVEDVSYIYSPDSVFQKQALAHVSFDVYRGEFIGIIGHTGSGKSTLLQHLNGLNRASSGNIFYRGKSIYAADFQMTDLRKKVGMVFQYPEHQLFEENVLKDVCFGPLNLGYDREKALECAREALLLTGLGEEYYEMSPFVLSGGQKRRAAIAGVLAMKPEILVLDEPTAGLDPRGRDEIYCILERLHEEEGLTIMVVSHSMEDMAGHAERLLVMDGGHLVMDGKPETIFREWKTLEAMGLAAPQVTYIMRELQEKGLVPDDIFVTEEKAVDALCRILGGDAV